ncbi:MAG: PAS domain S-box protein [Bacteroidia bacterium]
MWYKNFPASANLSILLQNSSELITMLDVNGDILYESPSIKNILGYTEKELIGLNVFELCHPYDKEFVIHHFRNLVKNGHTNPNIEFRFRHKNGHYCYLAAKGTNLLKKDDFNAILVNSKDITAQKKLEQKLHSKIFELDTFIYRISHDLKGPVSSIEGLLNLISTQTKDIEFEEILSNLQTTNRILQTRIGDIEKVANISRNAIEKQGLDIRTVIENTVFKFNHEFAASDMGTLVQGRLTNNIVFSVSLIEEIVYNMLKFSLDSKKQPAIKSEIQISIKESSQTIALIFTDRQLFIPFANRESIFNIFNTQKQKYRGSGVELYIVKKAVEKLFGKIEISSRISAGSKFTITFPVTA